MILASGVHTSLPGQLVSGLSHANYLTNETAYFEPERPKSLLIIGGGYIALEAAQMFSCLGLKVTVLQRSKYILSNLKQDIGTELAKHFRVEGIDVEVGVHVTSVVSGGDGVVVKGISEGTERTFTASKVFLAAGRRANADHISNPHMVDL